MWPLDWTICGRNQICLAGPCTPLGVWPWFRWTAADRCLPSRLCQSRRGDRASRWSCLRPAERSAWHGLPPLHFFCVVGVLTNVATRFEIFGRCCMLVIFVFLAIRICVVRPFLDWGMQARVARFFFWLTKTQTYKRLRKKLRDRGRKPSQGIQRAFSDPGIASQLGRWHGVAGKFKVSRNSLRRWWLLSIAASFPPSCIVSSRSSTSVVAVESSLSFGGQLLVFATWCDDVPLAGAGGGAGAARAFRCSFGHAVYACMFQRGTVYHLRWHGVEFHSSAFSRFRAFGLVSSSFVFHSFRWSSIRGRLGCLGSFGCYR